MYLSTQEQKLLGDSNVVNSAMWGMEDIRGFDTLFINHPIFGQNTRFNEEQLAKKTGCDFCLFTFYFDNHVRFRFNIQIILDQSTCFRFRNYTNIRTALPTQDFRPFGWDFTCMFQDVKSRCPHMARQFKQEVLNLENNDKRGTRWQYGNTPSCENIDFRERYWGYKYPR